jgi:hypothetical protein
MIVNSTAEHFSYIDINMGEMFCSGIGNQRYISIMIRK